MQFNNQFINSVLPNARVLGDLQTDDALFSVDSRTINEGEIFVAISGMLVDGHNFMSDALKRNAGGLMIAASKESLLSVIDKQLLVGKCVIIVENTLTALVGLATAWRAQFNVPIMAITGSVGKTSTKEIIGSVLQSAGKNYLVSRGNENSLIGVCLNVFRMRATHDGALFELGVSKRGEMDRLVAVVKPTTALITNIGHSHMEGIGSLGDIALEKRDIFKYFTQESIGIINGDTSLLSVVSYQHPMIKFGSKTTNQIQARKIRVVGGSVSFMLKIYREKCQVTINHPHASAVFNVLAATAATYLLGIPVAQIVKAISQPVPVSERFEMCPAQSSKGIIINDAYNASPESMKASLLAFQQLETHAPKIAVLGDMLELGVNSPFWHRQLGRFIRKVPSLRQVIFVGDMVKWAKKTLPAHVSVQLVPSWQEAVALVKDHLAQEAVVLVKGSYGTGLRHLAKQFTKQDAA